MAITDFIASTILSDPLLTRNATLTSGGSVAADKVLFYTKTQVAKRDGLSYEEAQPEVWCRDSFVENAQQNDGIEIENTLYYLNARLPLNNGLIKWTLKLYPARTS